MLAALGMFVFELSTLSYDELTRRAEWRHAGADRAAARPAYQFTGPGEERITLPGAVYREIADGPAMIATLREMAAAGEAYAMVDSDGQVWGSFVITAIDEKHTAFLPGGIARRIEFAIDLLRVDG